MREPDVVAEPGIREENCAERVLDVVERRARVARERQGVSSRIGSRDRDVGGIPEEDLGR